MPDLTSDIIRPELARLANEIKVATVGKVATFARSAGRVVVNLLQTYVTSDGVERTRVPIPQAVVYQPAGDGYAVAFDLANDDHGIVLAADSGWDQVWKNGTPARPQTGQRHTFGSAAFLPGGRLQDAAPVNEVGQMRLGAEDGTATIDLARARAVPLSLGTVDVRAKSEATITGPLSVTLATSTPLGVKLGSSTAVIPAAKAPSVAAASAAGWTAFAKAINDDPTVAPPLALSLSAAAAAAALAETLIPIGSTAVALDP